jgi:hypothetical protein
MIAGYYDKLYYQWQSDTIVGRFENSKTKELLGYKWIINEEGNIKQKVVKLKK